MKIYPFEATAKRDGHLVECKANVEASDTLAAAVKAKLLASMLLGVPAAAIKKVSIKAVQ
jgi:hypothetical protein